MHLLFIALLSLSCLLAFHIFVFRWLTAKLIALNILYKHAVYILLLWWFITVVVAVPISFILDEFLAVKSAYYINAAVGLLALYVILKRYQTVSLFKTVKLFLAFNLIVISVSLFVIVLIRSFVFIPFVVSGSGMVPEFQAGDYILLQRYAQEFSRGDVVVFGNSQNRYFIQRIIGQPTEEILVKEGQVYVNGNVLQESYARGQSDWNYGPVVLAEDEYFLLDDNRDETILQRVAGPVTINSIVGTYTTRIDALSGQ